MVDSRPTARAQAAPRRVARGGCRPVLSIPTLLCGGPFPEAGPDGTPQVDEVQERAIDGIIQFLDSHLD